MFDGYLMKKIEAKYEKNKTKYTPTYWKHDLPVGDFILSILSSEVFDHIRSFQTSHEVYRRPIDPCTVKQRQEAPIVIVFAN